ncbi:MAG: type II toxin-antitoxin system VapC family toxin, partial [Bifidobacteriaceae bacterium]|nr:type II toxin-antitoxin system VapC family toxin [Bifidobacteriaceae bacterium]
MLKDEPEAGACLAALASDPAPKMSAATAVELYAVVDSRDQPAQNRRVDALLEKLRIEIVPFDNAQAKLARAAYRDFGKGSGGAAK